MQKTVKIAGVQLAPSGSLEKNLQRAADMTALAVEEGARIVAMPQLFNTKWFLADMTSANFALSEAEDGPTITFLRELASKKNVFLIASIFEKDGNDYFNTAFVIGGNGEITGKYRKMHVPQIPLWEEKYYFKPGDLGFPVFETPFAKIGVQLCWDVFFPEGFRVLALKGAEIIFAPTASAFYHSRAKWERALSAAAHASGVYIFRINRVGVEEKQEFYGASFCVRPDGEFATKPAGSSTGIVLAEVDLNEISRTRGDWVFMKDRRPDYYGEITGKK
ncbi:acyltransferase [bacterium]|nr:MAG: acyltransferase [bacterium]